jgi:hypothetical protein
MGSSVATGAGSDGEHRHLLESPYAALEAAGVRTLVVNAKRVKNVPGRKTDIGDAQWLATLAPAGLLRGSFIPPTRLRELRLVSRQRQKLVGQLAAEKKRLHKVLTDGGIRLGVVVSDVHGTAARKMVKALIAGKSVPEVLELASKRFKASKEELFDALQGDLTPSHCFVLDKLMQHIEEIEARIALRSTTSGRNGRTAQRIGTTTNAARHGHHRRGHAAR